MDHAEDVFDGDIFIYRGGRAPQHVTHALIDETVDDIEENAFKDCVHLVQVDTHDGIRRVGRAAFWKCRSLQRIVLKSVVEIERSAFYECVNLESAELGDRLETIGVNAFHGCSSLTHLKLPSIITIGNFAFRYSKRLTDIELSARLEAIGAYAFLNCRHLQRIAVPLKRNLLEFFSDLNKRYNQFQYCEELVTVDLVGGTYKTVASLHMESWTNEMSAEINRINQVLPNTPATPDGEKTNVIRRWMHSVLDKLDYYKAEHIRYVKEGITLLELALWRAKLGEKEDDCTEGKAKKAKIDVESKRHERRITCGADIVIKNVLPFLQLDE